MRPASAAPDQCDQEGKGYGFDAIHHRIDSRNSKKGRPVTIERRATSVARPLVESGILAALGSVLVLIGYYVPVLGSVAALFWALPVAVVVIRHGLKWGFLSSVVTGLSLLLFIDWITAAALWLVFAATGLTFGWSVRSHHSSPVIIAVTTLAFLLGIISAVASSYLVTGFTIGQMIDAYIDSVQKAYEINQKILGSNPALDQFKNISSLKPMLMQMIPAIVLLASVIQAYVNFEVCRRVLSRIGYHLEALPPFSRWIFPDYIAFAGITSYVLVILGTAKNIDILTRIGNNALLFVSAFLTAEAFSVLAFYLMRIGIPRVFIVFLCIYLYVSPALQPFLPLFGILDILMDFRHLRYGPLDEI